MEDTYLVQRLKAPYKSGLAMGKDNPFAFGGGFKNGGLSDQAMDLLRDIFAFDYMGAAEFEFGAVPKALSQIAQWADDGKLMASHFSIQLKDVEKPWRDKSKTEPVGEATVYVICHVDQAIEVLQRIKRMAKNDFGEGVRRLKEGTRLPNALRPMDEWDNDIKGWLELDNGYFFFTDKEMWEKTAALFGVLEPVSE